MRETSEDLSRRSQTTFKSICASRLRGPVGDRSDLSQITKRHGLAWVVYRRRFSEVAQQSSGGPGSFFPKH